MTSGDRSGALDRLEAEEWSREPNPTWRPMLRRILTLGVAAVLLLVSLLILLGIIGNQLEAQVAVLATLMALIPLLIIVPTYLWLDRYEAEPVGYLVAAFLWGALIAVVGAFFLNSLGLALLVESHWSDPFETGAVYLAPITEETLKGLGIFLIYLLRRHEFDGIIDGIVYAGMIGAGFAFSENILYLGQAYTEMGNEGLTATFIVRGLMGPSATRSSPRSSASASALPSRPGAVVSRRSPSSVDGSVRSCCTARGTSRRSPGSRASSAPTSRTRCRSSSPSSASSSGCADARAGSSGSTCLPTPTRDGSPTRRSACSRT